MKHFPKKSIIIAILIFIALGAIITYAATGGGWFIKTTEAKGLMGHWSMDSADARSSTVVSDKTPYKRDGTMSSMTYAANATTDRNGQAAKALDFDGTADYIDVPLGFTYATTPLQERTMSVWFKVDGANTAGGIQGVMALFDGSNNPQLEISINSTATAVYPTSSVQGGGVYYGTSYPISTGQWYHAALVESQEVNYSLTTLYINGEYAAAASTTFPTNYYYTADRISLGVQKTSFSRYLNGQLDDARFYNYALSEDEVKQIYNSYQPEAHVASQSNGLVGHWPLDSASEMEGSETVTNTTFDSGTTGWSASAGTIASVAGGVSNNALQVTNVGANYGYAVQALTVTSGKRYKLIYHHKNGTAGSVLRIGTSYGGNEIYEESRASDSTWAKTTYYFTATAATIYIRFGPNNSTDAQTTLFDEISVKEVQTADATPNGNTAYVYGPAYTTDRNGQANRAMSYNGTSNYIYVPSLTWTPTAFSLGWWLYPNSRANYNQQMVGVGGWGQFAFHTTSDGSVYVGIDVATRFGPSDLPANTVETSTWQHFFFTFDNGAAKFYKNGQLLASKTGMTMPTAWTGFYFGSSGGAAVAIDGKLSDVRLYNRALSIGEIDTIYDSYRPKAGFGSLYKGLVGEWTMKTRNLKSSTVMSDITPYGNPGTLTAGVTVSADSTAFEGNNDGVDSYMTTNASVAAGSTVCAWIRVHDAPSAAWGSAWNKLYSLGSLTVYLSAVAPYTQLLAQFASNNYVYTNAGAWAQNQWENYCIYIGSDASTTKHYVNGVDVTGSPVTIDSATYTSNTLTLSEPSAAWNSCWDGDVTDVRVYNRALSTDEMKLLYDKGR